MSVAILPLSLSRQNDISIIVLVVPDNLPIAVFSFTYEGFTIPLIHYVAN